VLARHQLPAGVPAGHPWCAGGSRSAVPQLRGTLLTVSLPDLLYLLFSGAVTTVLAYTVTSLLSLFVLHSAGLRYVFIFLLFTKVNVTSHHVRFEVLTAVMMTKLFFWVVLPRRLVGTYRRFGETYCFHLQG
jgi:hypothetical protein